MLIIKNNQTVQEILSELKELSRVKTELKIIIESLPESLDSEIGLDHFLYMLTNYPRPIAWVTDNEYIFGRLELRGFKVKKFNAFSNKTSQTLAEIDWWAGQESVDEKNTNSSHFQSINLENTFTNHGTHKRHLNTNPIFEQSHKPEKSDSNRHNYLEDPKSVNLSHENNFQKADQNFSITQSNYDKNELSSSKLQEIPNNNGLTHSPSLLVPHSAAGRLNLNDTSKAVPAKTLDFIPQKSLPIKPATEFLDGSVDSSAKVAQTPPELKFRNGELELIQVPEIEISEALQNSILGKVGKTGNTAGRPDLERVRSKIIASQEVLASINQAAAQPKTLENFKSSQIATQSDSFSDLISDQFELISDLSKPKLASRQNSTQVKKPQSTTKKPIKINFGFWNPLRYIYLFSFGLVVVLSVVGITLGLPTIAYTIQISPEKKENQALFSFEKNFLTQQNYKFDLASTADTTGTISTDSSRARGKIRLLNKTGNNIDLNLSKFYLLDGDNRYNPVYDSTQVQTISIPSKNYLSGPIVELMVESGSSSNNQNFDLAEGKEMRPVNLQGVPLGPNFTGVVSEAITSNKSQSSRTVTDGDLRTLRASIESNLLNEKGSKLSQIDTAKYISNINWSTNIESEFNADHKLGDGADQVSMTARVSSDMYFLDKKLLVDKIIAREPKADQVTKIEISNGETAWNKDDQTLSLDVKYIYSLKNEISKDKLKEIAQNSGLDTTDATNKIKETYPRISEVKAAVSGVPVPLSPRIEVEMVQGNAE